MTTREPYAVNGPPDGAVELAEELLGTHYCGAVCAVIGRASKLYGLHVEWLLGANFFRAAPAGRAGTRRSHHGAARPFGRR